MARRPSRSSRAKSSRAVGGRGATKRLAKKRAQATAQAAARSHGIKRLVKGTARATYERHWVPGFAMQYAQRTGVMLSEAQVRRNKEFQAAVAVVSDKRRRRSKSAQSPLARALVTLGVREPDFKGKVGTSPDRGVRVGRRARGRMVYGTREHKRRNTP